MPDVIPDDDQVEVIIPGVISETRGRPLKTVDDTLDPDWMLKVITMMAEGASRVEVMGYLKISNDLFARWMKDEPLFSETIRRGEQMSAAWWERMGRTNLENRNFNYVGWYMNMKNRFGWKDKTDITSNDKPLPTPILGGLSQADPDSPIFKELDDGTQPSTET